MSGPVQRYTSATPEDDVIRPRPVTTQSPLAQNVVVDPAPQSPSEAEGQVVATASKTKPKRARMQWPKPTRAPKVDRLVPLSGVERVLAVVLHVWVFAKRVLTLGFWSVRRPSYPKLNRKDLRHYATEALKQRLEREQEELRREMEARLISLQENAIHRHRTVVVVNSKGGVGKTPAAVCLGVFAKVYTGNSVTLIDINQNVGTAWRWVGVPQSATITVYQAVTSPPFSDLKAFDKATRIHKSGMRFISSQDMDTITDIERILAQDPDDSSQDNVQKRVQRRFQAFIQNVKRFNHSLFIDTGNGMSHASNTAAVAEADVLVFPAAWYNDDSIRGIMETVHGYIKRGFGPKIRERAFYMVYGSPDVRKEYIYQRFCERLFAAYVAANFPDTPYDTMDPDFRSQKSREYADKLGITIDRLYLVPWSEYIAQKNIMSADFSQVGLPTSAEVITLLDDVYKLDIDTDLIEAASSVDIDAQLELLYKEVHPEPTTTA